MWLTLCINLFYFYSARKGLVTGIIASGFGFGSAVFSPLQTYIINPGKPVYYVLLSLSKLYKYAR